jgi:acyl carrier protein
MTEAEIITALEPLYREVLDKPELTISRELSANAVDTWDSLNHIILITKTEELLGIKFSVNELVRLQNVGDYIDLILSKLQ